jgi:polar amino acid transport system substrate-binding protein
MNHLLSPRDQVTVTPLGILLLLALLVTFAAAWQGTANSTPTNEDTLDRARRLGMIRIGYANEAPYGYLNTATGEITGEAPEVAREVLRRMGIPRFEPIVTEFGSLIPGLKASRFDVIAAGMYITPSRCREIAFSNPTYVIGESFIVRKGNPLSLHSFEDVARHPTARIGFVGGTVEHGYARAVGISEDRIMLFPDNISSLTAVRTGRIDVAAATRLTVHDLLRKARAADLERADPFTDPRINGRTELGYGGFGFRLQDRRFVDEFNRALEKFLGTPEHLELTRRFGITEETLPGTITAADLCEGNRP